MLSARATAVIVTIIIIIVIVVVIEQVAVKRSKFFIETVDQTVLATISAVRKVTWKFVDIVVENQKDVEMHHYRRQQAPAQMKAQAKVIVDMINIIDVARMFHDLEKRLEEEWKKVRRLPKKSR